MGDFNSEMTPMKRSSYVKLEDCVQVLEFPPEEFVKGRLVGPITSTVTYWFNIVKKDGQKAKVGRLCLDYDPVQQKFVRDICPYRASGLGQMSQAYYSNFLVRDLQNAKPGKKRLVQPSGTERKKRDLLLGFSCRIKEFGTKTWTPYRLIRMTSTLSKKVSNLKTLNVHKVKGVGQKFPVSHPKYGMDINVKYDPNAKGPDMYDCQRDDRNAVTEEEMNYVFQPLQIKAFVPYKLKEAEKDWKELKKSLVDAEEEDKNSKKDKKKNDNTKNRHKKSSRKDRDKKSSKRRDKDRSSSKKSSDKKSGKKGSSKSGNNKKKKQTTDWNM